MKRNKEIDNLNKLREKILEVVNEFESENDVIDEELEQLDPKCLHLIPLEPYMGKENHDKLNDMVDLI